MQVGAALATGVVGAFTLTLIHESARQMIPHSPQVHVLGERALKRSARAIGSRPPRQPALYAGALAGEIVSNSLYYALAGIRGATQALAAGTLLGLAAGVGAVTLPGPLGLGRQPNRKPPATELMTIAWYTLGGLAAGATYRYIARQGA